MAEACQVDLTCDNSSLALTFLMIVATIKRGSGCVPVDALVFKTSGRLR